MTVNDWAEPRSGIAEPSAKAEGGHEARKGASRKARQKPETFGSRSLKFPARASEAHAGPASHGHHSPDARFAFIGLRKLPARNRIAMNSGAAVIFVPRRCRILGVTLLN
ncbi:MAG: hypothetical protein KGY49_06735 [Wenzhouxiangellaceae bacterium]|nr:hypothetical protein [Wenzhouxiangellaceae bacterium]